MEFLGFLFLAALVFVPLVALPTVALGTVLVMLNRVTKRIPGSSALMLSLATLGFSVILGYFIYFTLPMTVSPTGDIRLFGTKYSMASRHQAAEDKIQQAPRSMPLDVAEISQRVVDRERESFVRWWASVSAGLSGVVGLVALMIRSRNQRRFVQG